VKDKLVGVTFADEFATAFWWWYERCQQCIIFGSGYVKKS
jgi:hypothetical protein